MFTPEVLELSSRNFQGINHLMVEGTDRLENGSDGDICDVLVAEC